MNEYFCRMLYKSMQYTAKCALVALVFCETLLITGYAKPLSSYSKKRWVIVIDAGHGGKDPGCHGLQFKEKDVALSVSLKLGRLLKENDPTVKVIYTRTTDEFIPLNERAEVANRNHADFFICVHCNASPDKTKFGSATYVMGLYKSEGNLEVAKRENSSVLYEKNYKQTYDGFDPNSPEGNIIFSMYQNMYLEQSLDLSAKIQKGYSAAGRTDNGVKQAGFLVLWKTTMPSLLTEIGFLTDPDEEQYLGSQEGQNKTAESIFFAVEQYIDEKTDVAFNAKDFKLLSNHPDSLSSGDSTKVSPDTSSKKAHVDSVRTKNNLKSPPVSSQNHRTHLHKDTSTSAAKIRESIKALHADSMTNASVISQKDTTNTILKNRSSSTNAIVKNQKDSTKIVVKNQSNATNAVVKNQTDSTGIIYKVQIVTSSTPLATDNPRFKGIQGVEMYVDKSIYKYTVGHFNNLDAAVQLQFQLRNKGFDGAFVVAFKGSNRVPIQRGK